jgi:hypothetical protein
MRLTGNQKNIIDRLKKLDGTLTDLLTSLSRQIDFGSEVSE